MSIDLLIKPVASEAISKPCDVTIAVQYLHRGSAILAGLKADAGVKVGVNGGVDGAAVAHFDDLEEHVLVAPVRSYGQPGVYKISTDQEDRHVPCAIKTAGFLCIRTSCSHAADTMLKCVRCSFCFLLALPFIDH